MQNNGYNRFKVTVIRKGKRNVEFTNIYKTTIWEAIEEGRRRFKGSDYEAIKARQIEGN